MPTPRLVVVSGPPGSGKTQLAHALAPLIPCPAICRDEIKEGMVHAEGAGFRAAPGDPLTMRTLAAFFDVLRVLLEAETSVIAEAAFQDPLWKRGLEPLSDLARLRIVQCKVDATVAWRRARERSASRAAHADGAHLSDLEAWTQRFTSFEPVSLPEPSIAVDTTDGYAPDLARIVAFVNE